MKIIAGIERDFAFQLFRKRHTFSDERLNPAFPATTLDYAPFQAIICRISDGIITYANPRAIDSLRSLEHFIPILPEELIGSSVSIFDRVPCYQWTALLMPSALPHQVSMQKGEQFLDLFAMELAGPEGSFDSALITWKFMPAAARDHMNRKFSQQVKELHHALTGGSRFFRSNDARADIQRLEKFQHLFVTITNKFILQTIQEDANTSAPLAADAFLPEMPCLEPAKETKAMRDDRFIEYSTHMRRAADNTRGIPSFKKRPHMYTSSAAGPIQSICGETYGSRMYRAVEPGARYIPTVNGSD